MLWRALRLRCPWCGARRTFLRGWFSRYERCRTCGLQWRREHGFELGPMTLNIIVTFIVLIVGMSVSIGLTLPDIPVARLVVSLVAIGVVVPLLLYPFSYTVWLAGDLAVHPPDDRELAENRQAVADADSSAKT